MPDIERKSPTDRMAAQYWRESMLPPLGLEIWCAPSYLFRIGPAHTGPNKFCRDTQKQLLEWEGICTNQNHGRYGEPADATRHSDAFPRGAFPREAMGGWLLFSATRKEKACP